MGKSEKKIGTKSSVNNQKPDVAVKKDDYSQVENNSEDSNSRNIILQTALKLFSERNYRAVTISDIAKETKIIQKSTIFYHFKTKLNLANKAIEFFMTEFEKEEFFAFMNLADPIEKLRHIIKGMLKVLEIYPKFGRFILDVIEANEEETEQQSSPSMDNQWIPFAVQMYEMVVSLFSECGVSNPGARALILLSSLDGMAFYIPLMQDQPSLEFFTGSNVIEEYTTELLRSLLSDSTYLKEKKSDLSKKS